MRWPRTGRLARRLLLAHVVVVLSGTVTLAVVVGVLGPRVLVERVDASPGSGLPPGSANELRAAFAAATASSLGIATTVSVVVAMVVSTVLAVRLARPVENLARTARAIEDGHTDARAAHPGADDELRDLTVAFNAMAARLERTELARRRLLSDLTHELRTPLTTLDGYLEGLRDGVVDPDASTWRTMTAATSRLRRLVDDVAEASMAEESRLELQHQTVDIGELASSAVAAARPACTRNGIDLDLHVPPGPPIVVQADPDRLGQVLSVLLTNARLHSPRFSTVTVRIAAREQHATVQVSDHGAGIATDDLPHVFDRFFRADQSRHLPGSGLGLTIARALARAHDGDLEAASDGPGQGATFTLTLPRSTPAT